MLSRAKITPIFRQQYVADISTIEGCTLLLDVGSPQKVWVRRSHQNGNALLLEINFRLAESFEFLTGETLTFLIGWLSTNLALPISSTSFLVCEKAVDEGAEKVHPRYLLIKPFVFGRRPQQQLELSYYEAWSLLGFNSDYLKEPEPKPEKLWPVPYDFDFEFWRGDNGAGYANVPHQVLSQSSENSLFWEHGNHVFWNWGRNDSATSDLAANILQLLFPSELGLPQVPTYRGWMSQTADLLYERLKFDLIINIDRQLGGTLSHKDLMAWVKLQMQSALDAGSLESIGPHREVILPEKVLECWKNFLEAGKLQCDDVEN